MYFKIDCEDMMLKLGSCIAKCLTKGSIIYLNGDLGAGKTVFSRGFIYALGFVGRVKSPTYTLVESYEVKKKNNITWVHHFDLYRLSINHELEEIGYRDYFNKSAHCLIEWSEKGKAYLPQADIALEIQYNPGNTYRKVKVCAYTKEDIVLPFLLSNFNN